MPEAGFLSGEVPVDAIQEPGSDQRNVFAEAGVTLVHHLGASLLQRYETQAIAVRDFSPALQDASLEGPGGLWRDVLSGDERPLDGRVPLGSLLDDRGIAVFERV